MMPFEEPDPTPGYKRLLVYADEGGVTGQTYSGFGSLWMPWERRGDFQKIVRELRAAHAHAGSFAANTAPGALLVDVVDAVFRRRWLAFRCLVTPTTDDDARRRSAVVELVSRRVRRDPTQPPAAAPVDLRLRLSRSARLADASGTKPQAAIASAVASALPRDHALSVRAARTIDGIELVELLTGLVVSGWERRAISKDRKRVADRVAENLGWGDLAADTVASEWKFNICFVRDPTAHDSSGKTQRAVQLLLPMMD